MDLGKLGRSHNILFTIRREENRGVFCDPIENCQHTHFFRHGPLTKHLSVIDSIPGVNSSEGVVWGKNSGSIFRGPVLRKRSTCCPCGAGRSSAGRDFPRSPAIRGRVGPASLRAPAHQEAWVGRPALARTWLKATTGRSLLPEGAFRAHPRLAVAGFQGFSGSTVGSNQPAAEKAASFHPRPYTTASGKCLDEPEKSKHLPSRRPVLLLNDGRFCGVHVSRGRTGLFGSERISSGRSFALRWAICASAFRKNRNLAEISDPVLVRRPAVCYPDILPTGILEESDDVPNNRGRSIRPSALGDLLFGPRGLDPYLE